MVLLDDAGNQKNKNSSVCFVETKLRGNSHHTDTKHTEDAQRGFQQQPRERSTKIHEITLTRNFVFVRVISWIVGSVKNLAQNKRNLTFVIQRKGADSWLQRSR